MLEKGNNHYKPWKREELEYVRKNINKDVITLAKQLQRSEYSAQAMKRKILKELKSHI